MIGQYELLGIISRVTTATTSTTRKSYLTTLELNGFVLRRDAYSFYVKESAWMASDLRAMYTEMVAIETKQLVER